MTPFPKDLAGKLAGFQYKSLQPPPGGYVNLLPF